MARPKKELAVATAPAGNKNIALLDAELSKEVDALKQQIGQSSGNKIRIEPSGDFVLPDGMNLGKEIKVIVLDFASRNSFYTAIFNKDNPTPPDCYAMGKVLTEMAPEDDSPHKQNDKCITCPQNAFGSAQNGKGKACQNRRLAAVLLVDDQQPDAHNAPDAPIYLLDLSPTMLKGFDGAISAIARALNGPPIKAILTVVGESLGTYAKVSFIEPEPNPDYAQHIARRGECQDVLYRKPDFAAYAAKAPPARGGNNRRPPARR